MSESQLQMHKDNHNLLKRIELTQYVEIIALFVTMSRVFGWSQSVALLSAGTIIVLAKGLPFLRFL